MKKRNIIIISVSVITLLFGGLVSLAVTTFPELIEVEKEKIEQSQEDVLFELPSFNDDKANKEEVVLTSNEGESATYVSRAGNPSIPVSHHSFKENVQVFVSKEVRKNPSSYDHNFHAVESFEASNSHSSTYYRGVSSSYSRESSNRPLINKEIKKEAKRVPVDSSAIMNTTIMAIGLCELLGLILVIKRKRHLRLR